MVKLLLITFIFKNNYISYIFLLLLLLFFYLNDMKYKIDIFFKNYLYTFNIIINL